MQAAPRRTSRKLHRPETCIIRAVDVVTKSATAPPPGSLRPRSDPNPRESDAMNDHEEMSSVHLPVSLCSTAAARSARSSDGLLNGTLTVPCPVTQSQVLLQRCHFCARSEGLFLDPESGSLH